MPESVTLQKQTIQAYQMAGQFPEMYRYIASQLPLTISLGQLTPSNEQKWLRSAALIATPGPASQNVLKQFVYASNNEASILSGHGAVSLAKNQAISDRLANDVGNLYLRFLDGKDVSGK